MIMNQVVHARMQVHTYMLLIENSDQQADVHASTHMHKHTKIFYFAETKEPPLEIPRRSAARPHAASHRPRHHARSEGQKGENGVASASSRELWARPGMVPRMAANNRDR